MHENWICWLYQYGVGGLVFVGTLGLALGLRALRLDRRADRWLLAVLVAGYFAWATVHALWIGTVLREAASPSAPKTLAAEELEMRTLIPNEFS